MRKGLVPAGDRSAPWETSSSYRGERGLSGSRPWEVMEPPFPRAQTTGSRNRMVEPDSPQSMDASGREAGESPGHGMGTTRNSSPTRWILAPSAVMHRTVASMSSLVNGHRITEGPSAREAQISSRCTWDLDGMAATVPNSRGEVSVMFMATPLQIQNVECRMQNDWC